MTTGGYPVFIPVRDRLEPLLELIGWLERAGCHEIFLIDNFSGYRPMRTYLDHTNHQVVRANYNLGHRSPWLTGAVQRYAHGRYFVVSDPDVIPDDGCPLDALDHLRDILERYPDLHKAGLGLRIDDLPDHYPLAEQVRAWEARFWTEELEPGVYRADIDTTFALYRPRDERHRDDHAARTGAPYVARHLPWYSDPTSLSEEERYYREHADPAISNWERTAVPRWKQRWLNEHR